MKDAAIWYPAMAIFAVDFLVYFVWPGFCARGAYLPLRGLPHPTEKLPPRFASSAYRQSAAVDWRAEELAPAHYAYEDKNAKAGRAADGSLWIRTTSPLFRNRRRGQAIVRLALAVDGDEVRVVGRHAPMPLSLPLLLPATLLVLLPSLPMPIAVVTVALFGPLLWYSHVSALRDLEPAIRTAGYALLREAAQRAESPPASP